MTSYIRRYHGKPGMELHHYTVLPSAVCSKTFILTGAGSFSALAGSRYPSGFVSHSLFFSELCTSKMVDNING